MPALFRNGTLYVNERQAVHTGGGGTASLPEECWKTIGGVKQKVKYINQCRGMDLDAVCTSVEVQGNPVATVDSITNCSFGDKDSEGGVKSGTVEGPMRFLTCSPDVFFEGSNAVRHGDDVISNNDNTEIGQWIQPGTGLPTFLVDTLSDPLEALEDPKSINIQVLHSENVSSEEVDIDRSVMIAHQETGHKHYRMLSLLPEMGGKKLLHANYLREGRYTIEEVYAQGQDSTLRIPLGEAQSKEKDDTEACVELLPLSFMRYGDIEKTQENIQPLFELTYLYLFKDGYLWRELKTDSRVNLHEVDLKRYASRDERIAYNRCARGVLLPLKDADGEHAFHIAVSHVQWSWAYIHLMGGLDPKDPRFEAKHHLDIAPDAELIAKRLKPLTQAEMHWDDALPTNRVDTARFNGGAVYVVDDPMGCYLHLAQDMNIAYAQEQAFLEEMKEGYIVGQLAEQILKAADKEGKDYRKHIHDEERKEHINKVDSKRSEGREARDQQTEDLIAYYDLVYNTDL